MKKLVVAEKPSVARDIARVLKASGKGDGYLEGDDYIVTWALGHLVTQMTPDEIDEKYKKWNFDQLPILPDEIPLKVISATKSQYAVVKKLMNSKDVSSIICATDSAREGELIFRYIYTLTKCKKSVERLWISSMTEQAIKEGFDNLKPSSYYDSVYESAFCRSRADWIVGMNASRAYSVRYNAHLPIGRVQTPTLYMIVMRDKEIAEFVPEDYFEVHADFGDYKGVYFDEKTNESRLKTEEEAKAVQKKVSGGTGTVTKRETVNQRTLPPQLYDLTTLQREANRKFGFSAERTLNTAQALYERHKLLTYPRTDSRYLSSDMPPKVAKALSKLPEPYASLVKSESFRPNVRSKRYYDDSKISDHHAIIPTDKAADLDSLNDDERRIYDLVARRLISIHYPDYEYASTKISTVVNGCEFRTSGNTPLVEGWHAVEGSDKTKEEPPLPDVRPGDTREVKRASVKANKTKPPKPHNDASLLGLMENAGKNLDDPELRERMKSSGLGTPATRAATIEHLIELGYARRSGKAIVSTPKGQKLIAVTPDAIKLPVTTGKWEKALYELANNRDEASRKQKSERFMNGIGKFAVFLVEQAKSADTSVVFEKEEYKKKRSTARRTPARPKTTKPKAK